MESSVWQVGRFRTDLVQPKIMGIANTAPDLFSDGGSYSRNVKMALTHTKRLLKNGADILDIGGEPTRPGADYVLSEEEWWQVALVLTEAAKWNVPISVDTRRTKIMRRTLE